MWRFARVPPPLPVPGRADSATVPPSRPRPPGPPLPPRGGNAYGRDVLEEFETSRRPTPFPEVEARSGLVARHRASGYSGVVVKVTSSEVALRGGDGSVRVFLRAGGAFDVDGRTVTLVVPKPPRRQDTGPGGARTVVRTASGSIASPTPVPARVARAGRILVEGRHDAELVERVWGDDLREAGVVVELLDGIDALPGAIAAFRPGPGRRLGVLVDHLVPGSKEQRLVAGIRDPHVLVTGTPFVDVWAAVRPHVVGLDRWPTIPKGTDWKAGVAAALGRDDPRRVWPWILGRVRSYADLAPELVGAVERLVDFVTAED